MEPSRNHYYGIVKKMLSFVGQWPYQKRRTRLFRVILVTVVTLSMIIPQMCKFVQCDGDVQCILKIVPSYLLTVMIMVKLYTCQFNSSKIKDLTDHLFDDWKKLETSKEYEIMKVYAANGRLLSLIYSLYCCTACGMFALISLTPHILDIVLPLNESRPILLPYEAYYFVDEREYFFYIFFHTLVGIEIAIIGIIAHDCMLMTYIEHVCSMFAVAGFRFKNLPYNKHIDLANNDFNEIYNQKIAISVNTHWRALEFAELLEDTFSVTFAIQIIIVTVAMSITLLHIALHSDDNMEATRYIAFVIGQIIHLFCFSLQGQKLIDHSLQIRDKIYNSSWYEMPVKSQMMLLYVMRRSLQPNFLSASRIYIFSMKSFTTVVQTSVSYFTVLESFQ